MTQRTFSRFYQRATGFTPARAVEHIRLEHACEAVETMLMSFKEIAQRSGFSSEEVMRRTFVRVLKMSPSQYRQQLNGQRERTAISLARRSAAHRDAELALRIDLSDLSFQDHRATF